MLAALKFARRLIAVGLGYGEIYAASVETIKSASLLFGVLTRLMIGVTTLWGVGILLGMTVVPNGVLQLIV